MKCPACDRELQEMEAGGIVVDVCQRGCGGIWFDHFELAKVDEEHEGMGTALLEIERDPNVKVDHAAVRDCPRCRATKLMQHYFSVKRDVEVDECPGCGGFWLDYGELGSIRKGFATEKERKAAAQAYFGDLFDDDLAKMRAASEAELRKRQQVAKVFRFICPSYYVPGKQDWGAF